MSSIACSVIHRGEEVATKQDQLIKAMQTGETEGATKREIARAARCSPATVSRYLKKASAAAGVATVAALPEAA